MKLSQTNGPLYHFCEDDLTKTLAYLKEAGFRYVDISFFERYTSGSRYFTTDNEILAEEYKRALETVGITPVQSHEPAGNMLGNDGGAYYFKKTSRAIDLAGRIGIPSITLHAGNESSPFTREEFMERSADGFKKHIPLAEKYGIRLLIENTEKSIDGVHIASADDIIELLERIDHPLFGACWDVGHANMCKLNQYNEITKLGDRLMGLHIHDNYAVRRVPALDLHQIPYWGEVNFDAVITALLEIDYKGYFNLEVERPALRKDRHPLGACPAKEERVAFPSSALRLQFEKLTYAAARDMLIAYNCFEE